jgi:hypothetical protein
MAALLTAADPSEPKRYTGPERRQGVERRQLAHRREEYRYEVEKSPRRSGKDRRRADGWDDTPLLR